MNVIHLNEGIVENVPAMIQERSGHSSVFLNNSIYVAGGQNMVKKKESFLDTVERFDLGTKQWHQCKPMTEKRSLFSLVCVGDHIYAIGGRNEESMCTAEKYDPVEDKWTAMQSMMIPRVAAAAVVLNDCIFVLGGSTKANKKFTETVSAECFNTKSEEWSVVGELTTARDYILATAIDENRIMAAGGFNSESKSCKIVEIYSAIEDKWSRVDDMATECSGGIIFIL